MAKRLSTAFSSFIAQKGSWADAFDNGVLVFYTGTQPSDANTGFNGGGSSTALVAFTETGSAVTAEQLASGSLEVIAGAAGDVITSIKISGIEALNGTVTYVDTHANFATALAAAINANKGPIKFTATVSSATVRIFAPKGSGTRLNAAAWSLARGSSDTIDFHVNGADITWSNDGYVLADLTGTKPFGPPTHVDNLAYPGVAGANLLNLSTWSTAGTAAKESGTWQGQAGSSYINTALADLTNTLGSSPAFSGFTSGTQTVGWFRYYGSLDDPELTGTSTNDTSYKYLRFDGTVGATGDMVATGGTTVQFGAIHTQNSFSISVPSEQTLP